jgi:hypothetical protein
MTTFYCLSFESTPTWRARSPYLYPPGTGWLSYTPRHWVLFSSPPATRRATVEVFDLASTPLRIVQISLFVYFTSRTIVHSWRSESPRKQMHVVSPSLLERNHAAITWCVYLCKGVRSYEIKCMWTILLKVWKSTGVSEDHVASIVRIKEYAKQATGMKQVATKLRQKSKVRPSNCKVQTVAKKHITKYDFPQNDENESHLNQQLQSFL